MKKIIFKKIIFCCTLFFMGSCFAAAPDAPAPTTDVWTKQGNFTLSDDVISLAKKENHATNTPFFYTKFVKNPAMVRSYLLHKHGGRAQAITSKTTDGEKIHCNYIDNNSDTLLVIGSGFTNHKEMMVPFVGMFKNYDIVIFDYRGHHYSPTRWYNPFTWKWRPSQLLIGINGSKTRMGTVEHRDVIAVVEKFKERKKYKKVCGLGLCYSGLIFIKSQAVYKTNTGKNLFDKLISDGTWLSLENQIDRVSKDAVLIDNPQDGGGSTSHCIGRQTRLVRIFKWLAEKLSQIPFRSLRVNILDYITRIDIPLFFFHGKKDIFVPLDEFSTIWNNVTNTQQTATLLPNTKHVRTHFQEKELYKLFVELAIDLTFDECLAYLQDADALRSYLDQRYLKRLETEKEAEEKPEGQMLCEVGP